MRKRRVAKIEGLEFAVKRMTALGVNVSGRMELAAHAGAAVVREIADANAPRSGVVEKETASVKPASAIVNIGVGKGNWYLQFFETGATEHEITGSDGPLVFQGDEGRVVTWSVDHPGMAAEPFLRPALDGQRANASKAFGEVIKRIL